MANAAGESQRVLREGSSQDPSARQLRPDSLAQPMAPSVPSLTSFRKKVQVMLIENPHRVDNFFNNIFI